MFRDVARDRRLPFRPLLLLHECQKQEWRVEREPVSRQILFRILVISHVCTNVYEFNDRLH